MKHYRRRRLLKALTELYLNNWKEATTYSQQQQTIKSLEVVGTKMRAQAERERPQPQQQLNLW